MAALGTTGTTAGILVPSKPSALNQSHVIVLTLVIAEKKAWQKLPRSNHQKEEGGNFRVWFAFGRVVLAFYFRGFTAGFRVSSAFEYYYFLITLKSQPLFRHMMFRPSIHNI